MEDSTLLTYFDELAFITEITEIGYGLVRSEKDTEGHRRCISHVSRWKVGEGTYLL